MNTETRPVLLTDLVRTQAGRPSLELTVDNIEAQFRAAVRRSGAFAWMGCVSDNDPDGCAAMDVYLAERARKPDDGRDISISDVVELFGELAYAHEEQVEMQLHLIPETQLSSEALRNNIITQCNSGNPHKLIWEERVT